MNAKILIVSYVLWALTSIFSEIGFEFSSMLLLFLWGLLSLVFGGIGTILLSQIIEALNKPVFKYSFKLIASSLILSALYVSTILYPILVGVDEYTASELFLSLLSGVNPLVLWIILIRRPTSKSASGG